MAPSDLDQVIEQYHEALVMLLDGDPEPSMRLWAHRADVLLLNPFGSLARGWSRVEETLDLVASHARDGAIRFEPLSRREAPELAYIVEIERANAMINERPERSDFALRATTVFDRAGGEWKIVHRHADLLTTALTFESLGRK
jgi:ketosteroid isomerase-like protein